MSWKRILKIDNDKFNKRFQDTIKEVNDKMNDTRKKIHDLLGEPDPKHAIDNVRRSRNMFVEGKGNYDNFDEEGDEFVYRILYTVLEAPDDAASILSSDETDMPDDLGEVMALTYLLMEDTEPMRKLYGDYPLYEVGQGAGEDYHLEVYVAEHDRKVEAIVREFDNFLREKMDSLNRTWKDTLRGNE